MELNQIFSEWLYPEAVLAFFGSLCTMSILISLILHEKDPTGFLGRKRVHIRNLLIDTRLYILALTVLAVFSNSYSVPNTLYVDWSKIPVTTLIHLLCVIPLTHFTPGYLLLKLVDRSNRFPMLARFVLSFVLSMFIVPLIPLLLLVTGFTLYQLGHSSLILVNLTLLLLSFRFNLPKLQGKKIVEIQHDSREIIYLILIFSSVIIFSYGVYGFQLIQDQRNLLGYSFHFSHTFPTVKSMAFPITPWWFQIYLRFFEIISNIPPINAYYSINFLNVIPVMSFYLMVKTIIKNNRVKTAIASTFFAFFSGGFGWIYAVGDYLFFSRTFNQSIYNAFSNTYDILTVNSYFAGHPDITSRLQLLSIPAMFMLIYVLKADISEKVKLMLIPLIVSLGYLSHGEFLVAVVVALSILVFEGRSAKWGLSVLCGFAIVGIIDLIAPGKYYTTLSIFGIPYFSIAVIGVAITTIFSFIRVHFIQYIKIHRYVAGKLGMILKLSVKHAKTKPSKHFLRFSLLYLYILCFLVMFFVFGDFHPYKFATPLGFIQVPFFVYPIKFGVIGLLCFFELDRILFKRHSQHKKEGVSTFALWILVLFFLLLIPGISDHRLNKYLTVPFSVFAAVFLIRSCSLRFDQASGICSVRNKRNIFTFIRVLLISSVLLLSSMSFIFYVSYSGSGTNRVLPGRTPPNKSDIEAFTFLYQRLNPLQEGVLSLPGTLDYDYVHQFGGAWKARSIINEHDLSEDPELRVIWPEDLIDLIHKKNIFYFYVGDHTSNVLESRYLNSIFPIARRILPVIFQNSNVTIYSTFPMTPATDNSDFTIMSLKGLPTDSYSYTVLYSAISGLRYSTISEIEVSENNFFNLFVTAMPSQDLLHKLINSLVPKGNLTILDVPRLRLISEETNADHWSFDRGDWTANKTGLSQSVSTGTTFAFDTTNEWGDFTAELDFKVLCTSNSDNHLGLVFRYENEQNFYYLFVTEEGICLFKRIFGIDETIWTGLQHRPANTTQNLGISLTGNKITVLSDGQPIAEHIDSNPLNGTKLGVRTRNLSAIFEELVVKPHYGSVDANEICGEKNSVDIRPIVMNVGNWSLLESAKTIFHYSKDGEQVAPFLQQYVLGDKTISYVNIEPFLEAIRENSEVNALEAMKKVFSLLLPPEQTTTSTSEFYESSYITNYFLGGCTMNGNINISSSSIHFFSENQGNFKVDFINLTSGLTEQLNPTSIQLVSSPPLMGQYIIQGSNFSISESEYHQYVSLHFNGRIRLLCDPPANNTSNLVLDVDETHLKRYDVKTNRFEIEISSSDNVELLIKQPTFCLEGDVFFADARFYSESFSDIAKGPTSVRGKISFRVDSGSYDAFKIVDLTINGIVRYNANKILGMNISWSDIFFSKENLIILLTLLCIFQFHFILQQNTPGYPALNTAKRMLQVDREEMLQCWETVYTKPNRKTDPAVHAKSHT